MARMHPCGYSEVWGINVSVRDGRDATLFHPRHDPADMDSYIVDDEKQLSPVVVAMTAVLTATFAVGILYAAVGAVL